MMGIDPPPDIPDPFPRDAARLNRLLGDVMVNWDRYSHNCVTSVSDVLRQIPDTDWIENPPSQRFAKERNVTGTILHAYEKHCEHVAAGGDYGGVDEAFWRDTWVSYEFYRSMFLDPYAIKNLKSCPICGVISDKGDGTVYDPPSTSFHFEQNLRTFKAEWSCDTCHGRKSKEYVREHATSEQHRFLLREHFE